MISIESDNNSNSNSNSNDSSNDTAMLSLIRTVSTFPMMMDIEILTVITLSLTVPAIIIGITLIRVYESIINLVVLIEIPIDMSNFIDIAFASQIIKVLVAVGLPVANEFYRDFERISMFKRNMTASKIF